MDIKRKIDEFKHFVIFGGLIIGFLSNWGKIPKELPVLGTYTGVVCGAVILLAGYSYYTFHHSQAMRYGPGKMPVREQRLPSRNISRRYPQQRAPPNAPQRSPRPQVNPNPPAALQRDPFVEFDKE